MGITTFLTVKKVLAVITEEQKQTQAALILPQKQQRHWHGRSRIKTEHRQGHSATIHSWEVGDVEPDVFHIGFVSWT